MFGKIIGTGSYIPVRAVDNVELGKYVDTSDEWVRERTGIVRRHVMNEETTKEMAACAAKRALKASGLKPQELDMIIVSTLSSDIALPSTACYVQAQLGAVNACCFDLNAACTGFLLAYNTVQTYFAAGVIRTALIIGAEGLSRLVDWTDRGTCILFGDGAGAAVLKEDPAAVFQTVMHADGAGGAALTMQTGWALRQRAIDATKDLKASDPLFQKETYIGMDGQAVFKFAVKKVPECINELMQQCALCEEDIDLYLLHQANARMLHSIAKRLHTTMDKIPMNVSEYGNTSSASIPILLDEVVRQKKIKPGNKVIMAGFGAGLTWGATYLTF